MLSIVQSGPPNPPPQRFNLVDYILSAGRADPTKSALEIWSTKGIASRWSYAELETRIRDLAAALRDWGFQPGDFLALRIGNTTDWPVAFLGAIAADVVPVVTSAQWTEREVTRALQPLAIKAILHDGNTCLPAGNLRAITFDELLRARARCQIFDFGSPERLSYVVFTSGTGGTPKPVFHAHRSIWARQMMFVDWHGISREDRVFHSGALNWTYTLGVGLLDPWAVGGTAIVAVPGVAASSFGNLIQASRTSIFASFPGNYRKLLRNDLKLHEGFRHALSAGERLPRSIGKRWQEATGTSIYEAYGMSECSTFLSTNPSQRRHNGLAVQRGRSVAIVDDAHPVARGMSGRIALHKSDQGLALSYGDKPLTTTGDWFVTGDMGIMDNEGRVDVLGRADDTIAAGGYRISPIEVEEVLTAHPAIDEAAVIQLRLTSDTTIVAAICVGDMRLSLEELISFCDTRLARYKHPRALEWRATLPRSSNGKLQRKALRTIYEATDGQA